ncbi:pyridoxal phosphate-dependent aminotransferase [Ohessyouella blattaphilus]|uniref:Aminotransferase n=1 Tax=Ohessyouella blattaphilus TaxID=2949333 RepID=A0ABT1EN51_9FIRM|nr:pyridoxal phosphate-dependent aminotransferase [Ohessyouella blattaphilus]MCP1111207.1 pyridoxal phosphate-dependent aminotransferase [Ohessyouella blattaphilus]MCR8564601.1 pyridoxal phosphate-dependent aminotransferase [Ohessyouella blattaphilus]
MSLSLSEKAKRVKPSSTLAITAKAKKLKAKGVDVVGFGAGEPDFDTPQNIKDAAIRAINEGFTKYTPAAGTDELRDAVAKKFKEFNGIDYERGQIVISNGGKHSLTNVFEALLNPGDEVLIPAPYWLTYPEIVKLCDGVPVELYGKKENDLKVTAKQIEEAITPKTKALILNTPSNPTGMVYSEKELRAIAEVVVSNDIYVVADEMYEHLIYGEQEHISIASLGEEIYKRTITCSGVSKSYAMTGWRIGYTGSSLEIAKLMSSVQSHQTSNPCSIAQKASLEAITGPQDAVEEMRLEFDKRRKHMYERIVQMPLVDTLEPEGAFYVFVDCTDALERSYKGTRIGTANRLAEILIEDYNVAVVPCADFGFDNYIRLSYAISMKAIDKGLDRLEEFLNTL